MSKIPEVIIKAIERIGFFNPKKADPETLRFRKDCQKHKDDLYLTPVKTGQKTWYFGGAGPHNLLFYKIESGLDVKNVSSGKFWVTYDNVNPIVRKTLEDEIAKLEGVDDFDIEKVPEKSYQQIADEIAAFENGGAEAQPLPEDFIRASELDQ